MARKKVENILLPFAEELFVERREQPPLKSSRTNVSTTQKSRMVKEYLSLFVKVTKHGTYIDGFAGPQTEEDNTEHWAALQVLESQKLAKDKPHLKNFFLFEAKSTQFARIKNLRDRFNESPSFNVHIEQGDCNKLVPQLLESGRIGPREATFILLDQRTFECKWSTLKQIAASRESGYKCEIFYLLANSWLNRAFAALKDESIAEIWWGRSDWRKLVDMSGTDRASLLTSRFREELGYHYASAWHFMAECLSESSRIHYFMVHASDHQESQKFMDRAYSKLDYPTLTNPPEQTNIFDLLVE